MPRSEPLTEHLSGEVARELDFYRVRERIAELCVSEEARSLLRTREPCADAERISFLKALGREWNIYLHSSHPQAVDPWPPVEPLFSYIAVEGAQLEQEQLFALGLFCRAQEKAYRCIMAAEELPLERLHGLLCAMPLLTEAQDAIFSIITGDGEVKAVPALRAITAQMAALRKDRENALRKYTSDTSLNGVLQSNVPVFRAERELLAVRADHHGAIQGIVHEVSASGQTLYIEPQEVVRANNELIQLEFRYREELKKLFREVTQRLAAHRQAFMQAHETLLLLDTTCAAARWQNQVGGVFAEDCDLEQEPPVIKGARHPLLGDRAVPVDIRFLDGKNILIITGPNTGGKTVTLKTIALFSLLNQAGFPVPAEEGTRLPLFHSVFADIGDEQSIDESLSTFSAHMKKIAEMARLADGGSLVLLDELGSGTDPQEGGAIAMATLDVLIERNSFVIATTHHGILKHYGYTNARCVNASVEFDDDTLRPTYRLLMGVPGESHAVDIAVRSGLPADMVDKARGYLASEQADVSALIKGLTAKHEELDELLRQEKERAAKLEQKAVRVHEREVQVQERELAVREAEHSHSSRFLSETRSKLENLVRELREGEITREKTLAVKRFISDLGAAVEGQEQALEQARRHLVEERDAVRQEASVVAENGMRLGRNGSHAGSSKKKGRRRLSNAEALASASVPAPQEKAAEKDGVERPAPVEPRFAQGREVLAGSERRRGVLLARNKNGTWSVQFGALKMNVPETQLVPIDAPARTATSIVIETNSDTTLSDERPVFELRLLGMRQEAALKALERQIDLCVIHNFREFSVIHGKGNGILQQAVHDYLSHYPGIKDFYFAPPEDGGTGKTYVSLL